MPNCVIEYALQYEEESQIEKLSKALHQVMIDSGLFDIKSIKTRAFGCNYCCFDDDFKNRPFLQITVSLLAGRSADKKKHLSFSLHSKAKEVCATIERIAVEIRDMDRDSYAK